ncbi:hypothetical protein DFH27DRAFT_536400 [Peziza echinospora]|nr:hypothetical protein DFH27DRAFT_536400 [Peziza echinospora]
MRLPRQSTASSASASESATATATLEPPAPVSAPAPGESATPATPASLASPALPDTAALTVALTELAIALENESASEDGSSEGAIPTPPSTQSPSTPLTVRSSPVDFFEDDRIPSPSSSNPLWASLMHIPPPRLEPIPHNQAPWTALMTSPDTPTTPGLPRDPIFTRGPRLVPSRGPALLPGGEAQIQAQETTLADLSEALTEQTGTAPELEAPTPQESDIVQEAQQTDQQAAPVHKVRAPIQQTFQTNQPQALDQQTTSHNQPHIPAQEAALAHQPQTPAQPTTPEQQTQAPLQQTALDPTSPLIRKSILKSQSSEGVTSSSSPASDASSISRTKKSVAFDDSVPNNERAPRPKRPKTAVQLEKWEKKVKFREYGNKMKAFCGYWPRGWEDDILIPAASPEYGIEVTPRERFLASLARYRIRFNPDQNCVQPEPTPGSPRNPGEDATDDDLVDFFYQCMSEQNGRRYRN